MAKPDELDPRLKAYLHRGATTPPPAGLETRVATAARRPKSGWMIQVAAAAALLVLAIGLGIALQRARQSVGVTTTASPVASPSVKPTPNPTPYPLQPPASMHMISATTGWAAGGSTDRILRTMDGGSHWLDVTPPAATAGTWITDFFDSNNAWLASSLQPGSASTDFTVAIYRTADGGRSWQATGQVAADQGWPESMDFVDRTHGWLSMRADAPGVDGTLYGTLDGGTTWVKVSQPDASGLPGHLRLRCAKLTPVFLNSSTGWRPGACNDGSGPFFYVTHDGGRTWNDAAIQMPPGYSGSCLCGISNLRFSDSRNGVFLLGITGADGLPHAVLYATHDTGAAWQAGPTLPPNCYSVDFISASVGWTLDEKANAILQTSDGGQHWSTLGTIPSSHVAMDPDFVSATVGWVMGSEPTGNTVLKTSDGGRTWTAQLSP